MFDTFVGLVLLAILVGVMGVGYGLIEVGIWLLRRGRFALGAVVLVSYSITGFVAFFIVLLGPAALILIKPRS